jgi:hypothetical protein
MGGTMVVLGILIGAGLVAFIVGGARRDLVNHILTIAIAVALVIALLALLTGHGLLGLGAAALLAVGEGIGIGGATWVAHRINGGIER